MSGALARMVAPMRQRLQLMISRGVLLLVNDALKLQGLQVALLADEVRDEVERFQDYGFTSHPHPGAELVAASVAGNRDHVVVLAVDDRRYRVKGLQAGEVAIYTDEEDTIVLKRGRVIEVTAGTKLRIDAPLVELTGDMTVAGTVTASVDVVGGGVSLKHHVHGGVDPGGGNTGEPV
jgi:phage gp45-like